MPRGRLTNNECACESPTIATDRRRTGNVVVVVAVVDGVDASFGSTDPVGVADDAVVDNVDVVTSTAGAVGGGATVVGSGRRLDSLPCPGIARTNCSTSP